MLLPLGSDSIAKQDEIYNVQKEVIREMAEKESCIIVQMYFAVIGNVKKQDTPLS